MSITECDSEDGITIGLIDGIIATCRVLVKRDLSSEQVRNALADLKDTNAVNFLTDWFHRDVETESKLNERVQLNRIPKEERTPAQQERLLALDRYVAALPTTRFGLFEKMIAELDRETPREPPFPVLLGHPTSLEGLYCRVCSGRGCPRCTEYSEQ